MGTYLNCYEMLKQCRIGVNEYNDAFMSGSDESGRNRNEQIVRELNNAQALFHAMILKRKPSVFLEKVDIVGVSSVFTLPPDFGTLLQFSDENGQKVFPIGAEFDGKLSSKRLYFRKQNTLVVNDNGATSATFTLLYRRKTRELDQGIASAGASTSITLASSAKKIADYYNGMTIENITQDWVDTITDYTAGRVATISQTAATNDAYGIVSDLPEAFHALIPLRAIIALKCHPLAQAPPKQIEIDTYNDLLQSALSTYTAPEDDEDIESVFCDFEPAPTGYFSRIISD